jgi:hypothetical protein
VYSVRNGTGGAITVVNGGTTGTDVPITNIILQNGGWTLSGTGTVIVPITGTYRGHYSITLFWGNSGSAGTIVSTVLKLNGSPMQGTECTFQQPSSATHQISMGDSFIAALTAGNTLIGSAIANSTGVTTAPGNGLWPLSNIQTVASITLNQIG